MTPSSTRSSSTSAAGPIAVLAAGVARGLNFRLVDDDTIGLSLDETSTAATVALVWSSLGVVADVDELDATAVDGIPVASGEPRRCSPRRSFTATTRSTNCSATSAGWPTATSPSTGR